MGTRYIGYFDPLARGKFLLEVRVTWSTFNDSPLQILLQLRDAGRGRLVVLGEWQRRFPDAASFGRVLDVQPLVDARLRHGRVTLECTLANTALGAWHMGPRVIDRADWHLVERHDEARLVDAAEKGGQLVIERPAEIAVPPLMQRLLQQVDCYLSASCTFPEQAESPRAAGRRAAHGGQRAAGARRGARVAARAGATRAHD